MRAFTYIQGEPKKIDVVPMMLGGVPLGCVVVMWLYFFFS
jgi:hypothetical protein